MTAISETVEAPEREMTRCAAADALRQVGEEGRELGIDAKRRVGRPAPAPRPRRGACCVIISRVALRSGSSAMAAGTASEKNCAPWLPPNTSSRNGAVAGDAV